MSVRHEELDLLETLVAGDAASWRVFVNEYQGLVYARVVRTAAEAGRQLATADVEDICADVFSSLVADNFASLRRFEGRSKLSTWLTVIARRVCLRRLRSRVLVSNSDQLPDAPEPRENVLTSLIAAEDLARMRSCVRQLPAGDQEIVKLYFDENLSYQQISRRLGLSINTIGPKLNRAQKRLKLMMGEPISTPQERSDDE